MSATAALFRNEVRMFARTPAAAVWLLLPLLAVVALCVALIVTGATMAPPDDAPITTATQTLGIALLVAGSRANSVIPRALPRLVSLIVRHG